MLGMSLPFAATLLCGLTSAFSWSAPPSAPSQTEPNAPEITAAPSTGTTEEKDEGASSRAITVQTTPIRDTDPPSKSKPGKSAPPEDISESPVTADVQNAPGSAPLEFSTDTEHWKDFGFTFSMPAGIRAQRNQLRHARLTLENLKVTHGDQHPAVKKQELVIQLLESTLQDQTELFDILKFTRSKVAEKKDAAEVKLGQRHPDVARLDAMLDRLDERIKVIEEAGPDETAPDTSPESAPRSETEIKVFLLEYCDAVTTAELLRELITDPSFRAAADERTNRLILTGTAKQLQAVEPLLLKLDRASGQDVQDGSAQPSGAQTDNAGARKQTTQSQPDENAATGNQIEGWKNGHQPLDIGIPANELQQQVSQLRKDYESADRQAHQLAESLRVSPNRGGPRYVYGQRCQRTFPLFFFCRLTVARCMDSTW
jgi:hypothetical protein